MNISDYLFSKALVGGGGGGGGSSWELLYSTEVEASTTSTTATTVKTIDLTSEDYLKDGNAIYWIQVRDKLGKRADHHFGTDYVFINTDSVNGGSSYTITDLFLFCVRCAATGNLYFAKTAQGVYPAVKLFSSSERSFNISTKYGTNTGTIDGTYTVKLYKLSAPIGNWFS